MNWLNSKLLLLVVAALPLGLFASFLFQWVKKQSAWVDNLPPMLKQGAVFLIAALVTTIGTALGVPIACEDGANCLAQLDQGTIKMLLEAALALGVATVTHKKIIKKR